MRNQPLQYRKLRKILGRYGIKEDAKRGKGSHRMLVGVVRGTLVHYPIGVHNDGSDIAGPVVCAVRRRFELDPNHGINDRDFYDC